MDKNKSKFSLEGTKLCSGNIIVSSGIPSLDHVLGGGLPLGTITLIEEDLHGGYSKTLLQYFLAEGVVNKHSIFVASHDNLVRKLPAEISTDPEETKSSKVKETMDEGLKIAFRYQHLPTCEKEEISQFGHYYDLSKTMPSEKLDACNITCWSCLETEDNEPISKCSFLNPAYGVLLNSIKNKLKTEGFYSEDNGDKKSILRIAIHSLGSPLWIPDQTNYSEHEMKPNRDLDMFIFILRALVRSVNAVAMITIPSHLYREDCLKRCIHSSDVAIYLQSFAGTELETNPFLSDYHGFFFLKKLAAVNCLISKHPGSIEYGFKLRRKKFIIEKLHLPPDIQGEDNSKKDSFTSLGCGSSDKHLLEF